MLLGHKRHCGLGMDALVIGCSWNTNVIMVWAWMLVSVGKVSGCSGKKYVITAWARMLWLSNALGTQTLTMVWAWMLWSADALGTQTLLGFGHGCRGKQHAKGVDVVMAVAWMLSENAMPGKVPKCAPRRPVSMGSGGNPCFAG